MGSCYKLLICVDTHEDNLIVSSVTELVKARHDRVIIEGIFDAYWRGFAEDTLAITVLDSEESLEETVELIKAQFSTNFVTVLDQGDATMM